MLFNSLQYAIFLPIVFIIYWILPNKFRWLLLLIASYYFYMSWNPKYVVLILGTTFISYISAILIEKADSKKNKKIILGVAAFVCLGVLFVFKYFNFAIESFCSIFSCFGIELHPTTLKLLLPVGISFYTFQTMSYVIDVYRGDATAEHHFGYYTTFISFFPQLVAGPIERTSNLLPQIRGEHKFNCEEAKLGIEYILCGLFKKIVIADTLSEYVDKVYVAPEKYCGLGMAFAILFFTLQIYCDFSGYSSIAIGSAKLLNIKLMENFNNPYFSISLKEFWKRWHISLSSWFKDYVYIPLGGNRCSKLRQSINLLITFLLSGLWHGANITFIIWGGIHGLFQVIENLLFSEKYAKNKLIIIRWIVIFGFCNFAWVFFRAQTLNEAIYIIVHVFDEILTPFKYIHNNTLSISKLRLMYIAFLIMVLVFIDILYMKISVRRIFSKNKYIHYLIFIGLCLIVVFFSKKGVAADFVYFQF